ncbi:MAG: NUDIX domain-containing protein [Myxococcota bacterium]|nr:NUDIX domain-containing protein [Myxococcota bacterium]
MKRLDSLSRIPRTYFRTAWWGLVSPRLAETEPLTVVQGVVTRPGEEEVLLSVRSDIRGWELPGGGLELDESPEQALAREVEEETGFQVEVEGHVGDYTRTGFRPHTARIYRCRVVAGDLRTSRETPWVEWWPLAGLPETLLPWYRQPLEDAAQNRKRPFARTERQGASAILGAIAIDLQMRWDPKRGR